MIEEEQSQPDRWSPAFSVSSPNPEHQLRDAFVVVPIGGPPVNRAEAVQYAENWIRDWCARDIERIVAHYAKDVEFISPVAAKITGSPRVNGREALASYWSAARERSSWRFTLERVLWDDAAQEMVVVYTRDIDGRHDRACELSRFDGAGQVIAGEAMYGAVGI